MLLTAADSDAVIASKLCDDKVLLPKELQRQYHDLCLVFHSDHFKPAHDYWCVPDAMLPELDAAALKVMYLLNNYMEAKKNQQTSMEGYTTMAKAAVQEYWDQGLKLAVELQNMRAEFAVTDNPEAAAACLKQQLLELQEQMRSYFAGARDEYRMYYEQEDAKSRHEVQRHDWENLAVRVE